MPLHLAMQGNTSMVSPNAVTTKVKIYHTFRSLGLCDRAFPMMKPLRADISREGPTRLLKQ